MYFLIYVSSAVELFSEKELLEVLQVSRKNNEVVGVTGMLLYKDGNFMQFLEGEKEDVLTVHTRISKDPRHTGLITLMQQEEPARVFTDWAMGFKKLGSEPAPNVPGFSNFLNVPLTSDEFVKNPSQSLRLLLNFKTIMR